MRQLAPGAIAPPGSTIVSAPGERSAAMRSIFPNNIGWPKILTLLELAVGQIKMFLDANQIRMAYQVMEWIIYEFTETNVGGNAETLEDWVARNNGWRDLLPARANQVFDLELTAVSPKNVLNIVFLPAPVAPTPVLPAPVLPAPVSPPPVSPPPLLPSPEVPSPVLPPPAVPARVSPPPVPPRPVLPSPEVPSPVLPPPAMPARVLPPPVAPRRIAPATIVRDPEDPAPAVNEPVRVMVLPPPLPRAPKVPLPGGPALVDPAPNVAGPSGLQKKEKIPPEAAAARLPKTKRAAREGDPNCRTIGCDQLKTRTFGVIRGLCPKCGALWCLVPNCVSEFSGDHKDDNLRKHHISKHFSKADINLCFHCGNPKARGGILSTGQCAACEAYWCLKGQCNFETETLGKIRQHVQACKGEKLGNKRNSV